MRPRPAPQRSSRNVEDLDLRNRCAKVRRKGNAADVIVWQTATARLLPRLLRDRMFLTNRRARVELPPFDLDLASGRARLSYRRAAELFEQATGGWTLHQLRPQRSHACGRGGCQHLRPARLQRAHLGGVPRPLCARLP
jgi:hypothetical protein